MVATTAQLAADCSRERSDFKQSGTQRSPACVELFRRAFDDDQEAWSVVHTTFEPLVINWVGVQNQVEPEEVVQDTFLQFFRYAPQQPSLVATEQLGPLVAYLRQTAKTSLLMAVRKAKRRQGQVSVDSVASIFASSHDNTQTDLRISLGERIDALLEDEKEQLIFHARFILNVGPKDIYAENEDRFEDYKEVATIIQRLTRRLRKDPILLDLKGARQNEGEAALLAIELLDESGRDSRKEKQANTMQQNCQYDEVALLDYVTGIADAELRAGIEMSPACVRAAAELRSDLSPILTTIESLGCPEPAQLVAYQERKISGTERLVLYRHIDSCVDCRDELEILSAVDVVDGQVKARPFARIIEAVLQPMQALPNPLRGDPQTYKAGDLHVNLTISRDPSQRYHWRLRGQVRDANGRKVVDIERIILTKQKSEPLSQQSTTLNEHGSFSFADIAAGLYELAIVTSEAELVIPAIAIGEQMLAGTDI